MFDAEDFDLNREYFETLDNSEPVDIELELNRDALDRIDRELKGADNE